LGKPKLFKPCADIKTLHQIARPKP
jgi:hypothetical protein